METIKLNNNLFLVEYLDEEWILKIFDYNKDYIQTYSDGKYHRVFAPSKKVCFEIWDNSYSKYEDVEIECRGASILLKNIILKTTSKMDFNSNKRRDEFIKSHKEFNNEDFKLILEWQKLKQREIHHKENMNAIYKVGRVTEKGLRMNAGLPLDIC
jgi:hypothetical protein